MEKLSFDTHNYYGPPIKHRRTLLERVEKFIHPVYFSDANLYRKLYPSKASILSITHCQDRSRISHAEAMKKSYTAVNIGASFKPAWSTHWFALDIVVPHEWNGQEVRLRWDSGSEAMVWIDGVPMQGLTGGDNDKRIDFVLTKTCDPLQKCTVYIEMAANGLFGVGQGGEINPPDPDRSFTLARAEIATFDREICAIIRDLNIMIGMVKELGEDSTRGSEALIIANDIVNCFQPETVDSMQRAQHISDLFFASTNGSRQYKVYAVGHCHIDSAWLWPYEETERKCGRSWSSTIALMKEYSNYKFACSQAQQFQWVSQRYPALFAEIKNFAAKGQFIPVGGTWVEMDGNLPSGEAFVRQFFYGQKYFEKEFGSKCGVFWLPDTFGYSAQLPQLMQSAGIKYFLTQKLSWSLVNKFPHNTFLWEGIDGTRCLSHFPPADTYTSNTSVSDIVKTQTQDKDRAHTNSGMLLFGYGDGGGGPTEDMIERLQRLEDVAGLPRIAFAHPEDFFRDVEKSAERLSIWVGELYLELHQGTFTTQAKIKQKNRQLEFKLQELEFLFVVHMLQRVSAATSGDVFANFNGQMDVLWKDLLLNQFHDVLPGSSIEIVNEDAMEIYRKIESGCEKILHETMMVKPSASSDSAVAEEKHNVNQCVLANRFNWSRRELLHSDQDFVVDGGVMQQLKDGSRLYFVGVPGTSVVTFGKYICIEPQEGVSYKKFGDIVVLENKHLTVHLDGCGRVVRMQHNGFKERSVVVPDHLCNQLVLYDDIPFYWDAWDVMPYHLQTRREITTVTSGLELVDNGPLRVSFKVSLKISDTSRVTQLISLDAESPFLKMSLKVDWNENRKFLKVEFPLDVRSSFASYEMQFGHVQRPTHANTSWDAAKHEVCGHKWVDISEHGFGVALLSDSKYGYSTTGNVMRISLLRSPKAPDANADIGQHEFSYGIMPHKGSFQDAGVIQAAYNFNCPLKLNHLSHPACGPASGGLMHVTNPAVIIENIKMAHAESGVVIVRLYESHGCTSFARLTTSMKAKSFCRCNILEEPEEEMSPLPAEGIELQMRPFEILSLMLVVDVE